MTVTPQELLDLWAKRDAVHQTSPKEDDEKILLAYKEGDAPEAIGKTPTLRPATESRKEKPFAAEIIPIPGVKLFPSYSLIPPTIHLGTSHGQ